MKKARYEVLVEQDESGAWIAEVPDLPGCHTFGGTRAEALDHIVDAIALWVETDTGNIEVFERARETS